MTRSRKLSTLPLAVLAFALAITPSGAAAASFLSSAKEKLLGTAPEETSLTNGGEWKCGEANITAGESSGTETTAFTSTIQYGPCEVFGFVTRNTPAEYTFLANGEVHLDKLFKMEVAGCEFDIPQQSFGRTLYATKGDNLLLEQLYTGVLYNVKGCLGSNGEARNGEVKANFEIMIANGTLSFMP